MLYPPNDMMIRSCTTLMNVLNRVLDDVTHGTIMPIPVRKDRSHRIRPLGSSTSPSRSRPVSVSTPIPEMKPSKPRIPVSVVRRLSNDDLAKMKTIYDAIVSYQDSDGRILSEAFIKLPTREEYPDYYEKIKKPMDLNKLNHRINSGQYDNLRAMLLDSKLIFDNACAFNEPNSRIYKDALILQKEVLALRNQYVQDEFYVQAEVKLLLTNLLVSVTTYTTAEGKCLSESLEELTKYLRKSNVPEEEYPFSLDEIKYNLDKGRYRRLDRFQDDLFFLFAKIREYAPLDSELFQNTIELQKHFIGKRDELCKNVLITPAKFYNENALEQEIQQIIKNRKMIEKEEKYELTSENEMNENDQQNNSANSTEETFPNIEVGNLTYFVDDYVYVASADDDVPSDSMKHIMRIEKILKDEEGVKVVRGIWCYKPRETYHLATRLFYQNEVFLTAFKDTVTIDRLKGKCCVMFVDDYLKCKPTEFSDDDIYVCESKYLGRKQHFKKLSTWPFPKEQEKIKIEERKEPLKLIKFKSELTKEGSEVRSRASSERPKQIENNDSISDLISERVKNLPRILDIHREEVVDNKVQIDDGNVYYEQMLFNDVWYRRGDGVLAFKENAGHCDIYRIDKMWKTKDGDAFISGPFFCRPSEVKHDPSVTTFYKREVIGVEQPDVIVDMKRVQARFVIFVKFMLSKVFV